MSLTDLMLEATKSQTPGSNPLIDTARQRYGNMSVVLDDMTGKIRVEDDGRVFAVFPHFDKTSKAAVELSPAQLSGADTGINLTSEQQSQVRGGLADIKRPFEHAPEAGGVLDTITSSLRRGAGAPAIGLAQLMSQAGEALGILPQDTASGELSNIAQTERERAESIGQDHPVAAFGGEVAGQMAMLPATAITKGGQALVGGVSGMVQPVEETGVEGLKQRAINTGVGTATGVIAPELLERGGRLAKKGIQKLTGGASKTLSETGEAVSGLGRDVVEEEIEAATRSAQQAIPAEKAIFGEPVLTTAQRSGSPFLLETQSFLGQLPASSRKASNFLERQNKQVHNAVSNLLEDVAPSSSITGAPVTIKKIATDAIGELKKGRTAVGNKQFKEAYNKFEGQIDVADIVGTINDISLNSAKGSSRRQAADKAFTLLKPVAGGNRLAQLDSARQTISEEMTRAFERGQNGAANVYKEVLDELKPKMIAASPEYGVALETFEKASPAITQLENSLVGRVSRTSDANLDGVVSTLFNPQTVDKGAITAAKEVIESTNPQAWRDVVRAELERRVGGVSLEIADDAGKIQNVPSVLRTAIFGNPKQREVLFTALPDDQKQAFEFLEVVLNRAAKGRPGGSQTGVRAEISKQFENFALKLQGLASPLEAIKGIGREKAITKGVRKTAENVFDTTGTAPKAFMDLDALTQELTAIQAQAANPGNPEIIMQVSNALNKAILINQNER